MQYLALLFIFSTQAFAADSWLCTHPQVCQLARDYFDLFQKNDVKLEVAIKAVGDPHHVEPTSKEIKAMSQSITLLAAPNSLHPWSRAIVEMRQNNTKIRTLQFETPNEFLTRYPNAHHEALAHFWLYPEIHCSYWAQFHSWLQNDNNPPVCPYAFMSEKLKLSAKKITRPIILSHDALVPLLRWLGVDAYAIRGSGHHEEPKPKQLKELHDLLQKHASVIWVVETKIKFPPSLKKMQRPSDTKLELDTSGDFPKVGLTPLQRLELMFAKL